MNLDVGDWLCKLGLHDWTEPKADVIHGTEYSKVCSRCSKLR